MDDRSDATLLAAWRRKDPRAFAALVDRHQSALLRHAQALLGGGDHEDVVQDAFLKLAHQPPALPEEVLGNAERERAALAAWLHRVTRNLCLDAMRSDTRRRRREEAAATHETTRGGLDGVEANDTRAAVERGLQRLPSDQREVLVLRLFGERSYQEIAEITGRNVGTIGWLISVGMKRLAGELAPLFGAEDLVPDSRGAAQVRSLQGGTS